MTSSVLYQMGAIASKKEIYVAIILGYACPRLPFRGHIPETSNNTSDNLMRVKGRGDTPLPDHNDIIAMYSNETRLHKRIFCSNALRANTFTEHIFLSTLPNSGILQYI